MPSVLLLCLLCTCSWLGAEGQTVFNRTFIQPATGTPVCVGNSAVFNCTIEVFLTGGLRFMITDSQWSSNGALITDSTPGHILLRTGGRVTGLMVDSTSLDDDGTVYNCTSDGAPADFTSSAVLSVVGGPPSSVGDVTITVDCLNITASWDPFTSDSVCGPVSYDVTMSPSDGVVMMRITDTSYNFTGLTPDNNYTVTVAGRNDAGVGESSSDTARTVGPPSRVNVMVDERCETDFRIFWNADDSRCRNMSYYVTLTLPNTMIMAYTTVETYHNFTGLSPNSAYNVTVTASNEAGRGEESSAVPARTATMVEARPIEFTIISETGKEQITFTWTNATSTYCGNVLYYYEVTAPFQVFQSIMEINSIEQQTITNLRCDTVYNITVIAYNRAGDRTAMKSALTNKCQDNGCWPIPCLLIILAIVILLILILVDCGCYYYIYKKVKSGCKPHPAVVVIFAILTLGIGWFLYKHLINKMGPSKIGLKDIEKTPSPEPVAYATTETSKVRLKTSDSTDSKKKKSEKEKKLVAEPANQGGLTYADLDIQRGPAPAGSIFPQERATYGEVKPSYQ